MIEIVKNDSAINYTTKNLLIGDFIIKTNEEITYIIERKSILDLSASIIDGRFREQKQRLIESINNPSKIIYIIEGSKKNVKNLPKNTIDSAILNLVFKHGFNVIQTENIQDTYENISLLLIKCSEINHTSENKNNNVLIALKRSSKIMQNIMVYMLSSIPGVSILIAEKIHEKYKCMKTLLENLTENSLKDIQITNKRKL